MVKNFIRAFRTFCWLWSSNLQSGLKSKSWVLCTTENKATQEWQSAFRREWYAVVCWSGLLTFLKAVDYPSRRPYFLAIERTDLCVFELGTSDSRKQGLGMLGPWESVNGVRTSLRNKFPGLCFPLQQYKEPTSFTIPWSGVCFLRIRGIAGRSLFTKFIYPINMLKVLTSSWQIPDW